MTRGRASTAAGRTRARPRSAGSETGAALTLVVLFLPCLLVAAALVLDAGALLIARAEMRVAADMGALAGIQDLDYDLLADGVVVIDPGQAAADAEAWVRDNLTGRAFVDDLTVSVDVTVCNTSLEPGVVCPVTGRALREPTLCVLVGANARLPFLPRPLGPVRVMVHADATVVGRPPDDG